MTNFPDPTKFQHSPTDLVTEIRNFFLAVPLALTINEGKSLKDALQIILSEYEVDPGNLEQDILELLDQLQEKGLVEIVEI